MCNGLKSFSNASATMTDFPSNPETCEVTRDVTRHRRTPRRLQRQRIISLTLDSVTTAFVLRYLYTHPSYLNPWDLSLAQWIIGFVLIRGAIAFYDHLVVMLIDKCFKCKVLPTREAGAPPVRYVELDIRSITYLSINSFNEYAFVMRLTSYLWNGGYGGQDAMPWQLSQLTLGNSIFALGIMFLSMDILYAPIHHLLHLPSLYPYIHKHHHRQHFPTRGYLDAGNEHPIEHMVGVMCTWFAVGVAELALPSILSLWEVLSNDGVTNTFSSIKNGGSEKWVQGGGVHAATVLLFFQVHAALAMMNHSPYDAEFSLPFPIDFSIVSQLIENVPLVGKRMNRIVTGHWFRYSVGHHEMHHRKFNFNYGQYCMWYDLMMGTFIEYEGPLGAKELEEKRRKLKNK